MHNVEGVRFRNLITPALGVASTVDLLAPEPRTQYNQGRSRVLRIHAARTWVNCSRARLDLLFVHPPPPAVPKRGSGSIGVRGRSVSPTPPIWLHHPRREEKRGKGRAKQP